MWFPFLRKYPEHCPEDIHDGVFDYIVVGGGTAGCVLASRLSENPKTSVLLLERGIANDKWLYRIPLLSCDNLNPATGAVHWYSEPLRQCDERRDLMVVGEVLGGASRINSMVYTRSSAADYDAWKSMGHPGWGFEEILQYFTKAENALSQPKMGYRGYSGPWINQKFPSKTWSFKIYHIFQKCAIALGFDRIEDVNSPDPSCDGIAAHDLTIDHRRQRVSTQEAYLPRATVLERPNLKICTGVIVSKVGFSRDKGQFCAEQVKFQYANSKSQRTFSASVKKEVIVSSGAIGSPKVLMLSGIGPRKHLEEHGIDVVQDLPGVGSELSDHMAIPVAWEVPLTESLAYAAISPLKGALEFLKYILLRIGILSLPLLMLSLFVRSSSLDDDSSSFVKEATAKSDDSKSSSSAPQSRTALPDIEIMPLAYSSMDDLEEHKRRFSKMGVFSLLAAVLRPKSRGTVRLASSNAHDRPKVDLGFLQNPADWETARKAVRLALRLGDAVKAQGFPLLQGISVPESEKADAGLDSFIRHRARTTYHFSSTCRMAPEQDPQAPGVVDDSLRVYGTSNLRVCDASIFPQIVASHLQAPVVMVAEKCADLIKANSAKERA